MSKQHWICIVNMILWFYYIYSIDVYSLFSGLDPYRITYETDTSPHPASLNINNMHRLIIQFTCLECLSSNPKVDPKKKSPHVFFERSKGTIENPAPPGMYETLQITGYCTYQL